MIRLAIIGLGAVTRNIHLPAYAQLAGQVQVVGGCDPDAAAGQRAVRQWKLPAWFEDPAEMIRQTRPDLVAICTPPALHLPQCLLALQAGCHVFCEKPLAESLTQADAIIRASAQARKLVVVNTQFPCMKIYQASKALIGTPGFGRLLFLNAWQTFRPTAETEAGWRGELQRRLCFEFGVHVFELIRFFFDQNPVKLLAHMPRPDPSLKSDVLNIISLEFADGRAATIILDRLSKGPERYLEMRLDGEHAAIHTSIGGEVRLEVGLHTRERRPFGGFTLVKGGQAVLQDGNCSRVIGKDGLNPFAFATAVHLRNFIQAIETGTVPPCTAEDNRHTLALAFAAYDSAELGRVVELASYYAGSKT